MDINYELYEQTFLFKRIHNMHIMEGTFLLLPYGILIVSNRIRKTFLYFLLAYLHVIIHGIYIGTIERKRTKLNHKKFGAESNGFKTKISLHLGDWN